MKADIKASKSQQQSLPKPVLEDAATTEENFSAHVN